MSTEDKSDQYLKRYVGNEGIFALRGNLDGDQKETFSNLSQFIGLVVGQDEVFLPIESVSEIVMINRITYVPRAHKYIEGVINLRGNIVPAVNLRLIMGLAQSQPTAAGRIIICKHAELTAGIIVDAIRYVIALTPDEIERQNLPTKNPGADLIEAVSKRGPTVNAILDIGKVITTILTDLLSSADKQRGTSA